ncbi:ABC transporter permease [Puteibacter caeruleilacunae]|nr:ABC transporter permease [Puteibacter caeruleilacunae]
MWNYILKISLRNIFRQRLSSLLVFLSICTGLVTFIFVSSYVTYEKSYDTVFPGYENIYRITTDVFVDDELKLSKPQCERSVGTSLVQAYPNVETSGYFVGTKSEYKIGENVFRNENTLHASPGILQVFSIDLISGNRSDVLTSPYKVLVSESLAKMYFGTENPVGKIVHKYPGYKYTVEGVFKDIPSQAHFKADMLLSFHNNMHLPPPLKSAWGEASFYTYIKVDDHTDIATLEGQINQLVAKNKGGYFDKSNTKHHYSLQSLKDIHLKSHMKNEITTNSRTDYLYILLVVGLLIVLAAGLNYLYFAFVNSIEKAGNTGIQKIIGADNSVIVGTLLTESLIIHTVAVVFSLLLSMVFAPLISNRFGINIDFSLSNHFLVGGLSAIVICSTLINGLIPAMKQSSIKSIDLLKLKKQKTSGNVSFRQLFISLQFVIVIAVIIGILGINKQINYLVEKEKGLSIENKLVVRSPSNLRRTSGRINNLDAFEQELISNANIKNVTTGNTVPGNNVAYNFTFSEIGGDKSVKAGLIIGDKNFLSSYDIPLVSGQNFHDGSKGCIINETCLAQLGYNDGEQAIGKEIRLVDDSGWQEFTAKVVGVTKDYNFQSAKEKTGAIVLLDWTKDMVWGNYTISLSTADYSAVIPFVKECFEATFTNYPFEFFILEDSYNDELKGEMQLLKILKVFVVIALIISVINLFSMAWHNTSARVKEIGIRKVNGAKISEILSMLNRDFIKWIAIAFVIACPIAYYAMDKWLENFAYQTSLSWWIFALAGIFAFGVAVLTVSWQSWKAATRNPVEALRYE